MITLALVPVWARWLLVGLLAAAGAYQLGRTHEAKLAKAVMDAYKSAQVAQTEKIVKGETEVVIKTETVYRDRIQKIYIQGEAIANSVPVYVRPADNDNFAVNAGFLRIIDAAWAGEAPGPAEDSDREPAGVPLSDVAEAEVGNATSCRAWREQVIGWRGLYAEQQRVINGAPGAWYTAP